MRERVKAIVLIVTVYSIIYSATLKIGGEQEGTLEKYDYIVTSDIIVPEGKTLKFQPGSSLSFYPYTGIIVNGVLECDGAIQRITFKTSDSLSSWNGIKVNHAANIHLRNVRISNSVYGLSISDSACIGKIDSVTFTDNEIGLSIGSKKIVSVDTAYKYVRHTPEKQMDSVLIAISRDLAVPKKRNVKTPAFQLGLLALSSTSLALWTNFHGKAQLYDEKYHNERSSKADSYRNSRDKYSTISKAAMISTFVSSTFLTAAIVIDIDKFWR